MEQFDEIKRAFNAAHGTNNATKLLETADAFAALGTPEGNSWSSVARSAALVLRGDFHEARERLLGSLDDIKTLKDDHALTVCYTTLGISSQQLGHPNAIEMFQQAYEINERNGNIRGMAASTSNIGIGYFYALDNQAALTYFSKALEMYTDVNDRNGIANTTCNVGNTFSSAGDFPTALKYQLQALAIHEETGNRNNNALVCGNIGRIYSDMNDLDNAMSYFHRALDVYTELQNKSGIGTITGQIASALSRASRHQDAIPYHRAALDIFRSSGQRQLEVMTLTNLTSDLTSIGAFEEARTILSELESAGDSNSDHRVIQSRSRAVILRSEGKVEEAITLLTHAVELATESGSKGHYPGLYLQLRDLCKVTSDFEGYISYNELYQKAEEEIRGADQHRKIALQEAEQRMLKERQERERERSVLYSTLPKSVADRVIRGEVVNDQIDSAAVIFVDIVGFTDISSRLPSEDVVGLLDNVFGSCDRICAKHNVTKIKTIGDSYMGAALVVEGDVVRSAALAALEILDAVQQIHLPADAQDPGSPLTLSVRIGIHCGPVTAGVLGKERLQYDVWGDTVNVASRMEGTSEPGKIHVSSEVARTLAEFDHPVTFLVTPRGQIDVKGKGMMQTYWLSPV